jgi:UDP-GlcNAc:undecaprenyl-phosphate GlcNAc-1-phosphate transferase
MFDDLLSNSTETFWKLISNIDILHTIPEQYFKYLQFAPLFLISISVALLVTPLIGYLAVKWKILDLPSEMRANEKMINKHDDPSRHIHTTPIPFLGGLAVILPLIILSLIFLKLTPTLIPILIGLLIITISGILDDKYNLPPTVQLFSQVLAASVIVLSTIDITFINNPFNGYFHLNMATYAFELLNIPMSFVFPGDLIILPWIILCINALKWSGGSDGLIETNSLIAFVLLFVLGVRVDSSLIATISIMSSGLIFGYLYYNYPPAKIFSGSVGKTAFGFLIATLALVNGAKVATTIIIIALPLVDAVITTILRYFKYRPKNIFMLLRINDKSHLHHQLIDLGLSSKHILLVESSIALIVGSLAILTTGANKLLALILVIGTITAIISIIRIKNATKKANTVEVKEEESPESKYSY